MIFFDLLRENERNEVFVRNVYGSNIFDFALIAIEVTFILPKQTVMYYILLFFHYYAISIIHQEKVRVCNKPILHGLFQSDECYIRKDFFVYLKCLKADRRSLECLEEMVSCRPT
jgi:hypothetical protein